LTKIAVCIPTFNQCNFLPIAVRSCLEQRGVEIEVWVSDDASTDRTSEVMREFEGDNRVRFTRQESNRGIAANAGWVMEQPETDFLVRLDSDDILEADYCRTLSELLLAHTSAGVAHCNIAEINEKGVLRRVRRLARQQVFEDGDTAFQQSIHGYKVAANICMFRKEYLRSLPFIYRTKMNFCEDWDLFVRLAIQGFGNAHSRNTLAKYRVWSDAGGYRKGRKIAELIGIQRMFTETIEPEWHTRKLDSASVTLARKSLALNHLAALQHVPKSSSEFETILDILAQLARLDIGEIEAILKNRRRWQWLTNSRNYLSATAKDLVKRIAYR